MKIRIYIAAIIVVAGIGYVGTSQAAEGFSPRSLTGTYGFSGSGTLLHGAVQSAVVGVNSFDRAGRCGITARLNAGGLVTSLTSAACSYSVNPDGTGSIHVRFNEPPFAGPFVSDFVIVDDARELQFILSDASGGTVASGVAKKQAPGDSE